VPQVSLNTDIEFRAPWSSQLRLSSKIGCGLLAGTAAIALVAREHLHPAAILLMFALPAAIIATALRFMVRGYVLTDDAITVRRGGWLTHLPTDGLLSVSGDNEAMAGSLRLFGNAGLFAFTGEFWNRKLGRYRALATDPSRSVVLRYANRRVVITPDDPQRFIVQCRMLLKARANEPIKSRWE
jgi:hypothetical protein